MYNPKDIQFAGKYDYDKDQALKYASFGGKTFSVNIFQWVLKSNGKTMKPAKGIVRVSGICSEKDKVFEMVENVIKLLESGDWDGRKTVIVK